MINTHLKFEAKIPNGSKVFVCTRNYTKANLTLNVKVKVTSFQTYPRYLDDSINSLSVKEKYQMGILKSFKQIFSKFVGQLDLEGQGQGHKFLE